VAFLQEEFGLTRQRSTVVLGALVFVLIQPVVFLRPVMGEMDFWAGTFALALFALIEVIAFGWVFGMDRAWEEITRGADIRIPRAFYYIIKYVTPLYLIVIFGFWTFQQAIPTLRMEGVAAEDRPAVLLARVMMLLILVVLLVIIGHAFRRRARRARAS